MSNTNTIQLGPVTIAIPESCPQPDIFKAVFAKVMTHRFGLADAAADAASQWKNIRVVPQPFAANGEAARHYREACLALNPKAKAWDNFADELFRAFLDFDEDGSDQTPPIPGWSPDWVDLACEARTVWRCGLLSAARFLCRSPKLSADRPKPSCSAG